MAKQTINVGETANDRQGDSLRSAFQKVNANFTELYSQLGLDEAPLNLGAFTFENSTISTEDSSSIIIDRATTITSDLTVGGDILPSGNLVADIGSATNRFRDLYLSGSTIDLGGTTLSVIGGVLKLGGTDVITQTELDAAIVGVVAGNVDLTPYATISSLADVATSGDYADLTNNPTIPVNINDLGDVALADPANGDLLTYFNGEWVNAALLNYITTGSNVSVLNNDAGYITAADIADGTLTIDVNNTGDLKGSVFGDDSTLLIDGVASKINLAGTVLNNQIYPSIDNGGSVGTSNRRFNEGWFVNAVYVGNFGAEALSQIDGGRIFLTNTPSQDPVRFSLNDVIFSNNDESARDGLIVKENIGGTVYTYLVANNITKQVDFPNGLTGNLSGIVDGDLTGSVFADDSTLLVDGVNGKIVAPININDNEIFDGIGDTGLNIRSNQTDGNIYLYSYGSDGDGTGAGNIYVKSNAVEIYSDWRNGGAGEKKWTFGSDGNLTIPGDLTTPGDIKVGPAGLAAPSLSTTVNEQNGVAMDLRIQSGDAGSVTGNIYITASEPDEFGVRGKVFIEDLLNVPAIETGSIQPEEGGLFIGVPTDNALQIMAGHTINEFSSINSSLFWSWDNDVADFTFSVPGEVKVQDTGGSNLSTRYTTEFIEFQGASQLSIPLDGYRSQFAVDIVNKEVVISTAETGSGQDVLVVQPGSVIFTTDYYFIDSGTYYQVTGVTDLGGGFTQLDIPGFDFTSLIGPIPVELFDSSTNTAPHEVRIDSGGNATGIRSLTGVTGITGQDDQYLYLLTSLSAGTISSNIAMTSVGGVRNTLNGTTDFGSGATVDFANATVTNWNDPNVVNKHGGSAAITVGAQTATMDNLSVRVAENTPGQLDVEFNYDAGATALVSANGDVANRFSGTTSFAAGNTTWTTINVLTTVGDKGEFTIVDHSYHKIYRVTTFAKNLPSGGAAGDAYCVIERLK